MANPLPFFKFYVDAYQNSRAVRGMNLAEQGLYIQCFLMQWRDGDIPDDPVLIARYSGCSLKEVRRAWPKVRAALHLVGSSLASPRLLLERSLASAKQEVPLESENVPKKEALRASDSVSYSSSISGSLSENTSGTEKIRPRARNDVNPRTGFAKSIDTEFSALAEAMYGIHPKTKDWPLVPAAVLRALERVHGDGELIRFVHGLWCKTEDWREKNGRFCSSLAKWLDDRGWEAWPDEYDSEYRNWCKERTIRNEAINRNGSTRQQHNTPRGV